MCGIALAFSYDGIAPDDVRVVSTMIAHQRSRGPDHVGRVAGPRFALAHARLRIVDSSPEADQPFASDDGRVHLCFNGEIFNHRQLRQRLIARGVAFRTESDTETVLRLYEERDLDFTDDLEGQFAICIVDDRRRRLILCRDRFGICPLYYAENGGRIFASSSLSALATSCPEVAGSPDPDALAEYLLLRYVLPPRTITKGVKQVRPAELLVFDERGKSSRRFWHLSRTAFTDRAADGDQRLRDVLTRSIEANLMADGPLATFLSGGLDSSIVTTEAARLGHRTLTSVSIQFGHHQDEEAAAARLLARHAGCDHVLLAPGPDALPALISDCLQAQDHPSGARDAVAIFALARHLRATRPQVKVVLTGTGADELFNGYRNAYFDAPGAVVGRDALVRSYVERYAVVNPEHAELLRDWLPLRATLDRVAGEISEEIDARFPGIDATDPANLLNAFYLVTHLVGWELGVQDSMCMAFGLEPRVPFLGLEVVTHAMSIPGDAKCRALLEKEHLRRAFSDRLPPEIRARPKLPLSRPVAAWMWDHGLEHVMRSWRGTGLAASADRDALVSLRDFDLLWRWWSLEAWLDRTTVRRPSSSSHAAHFIGVQSSTSGPSGSRT